MDDHFFVYILTNKWRNVLYTGLTDSLESRLSQHKDKVFDGFTKNTTATNSSTSKSMTT